MDSVPWHGVLLPRERLGQHVVEAGDRLADAAKVGDWQTVFAVLDGRMTSARPGVNDWRVGGSSWFTPLHQAAWLGADERVVRELIDRGAWRTLPDSAGRRPVDLAQARGNDALLHVLTPPVLPDLAIENYEAMSRRLADVVESAARPLLDESVIIRHVRVEDLVVGGRSIWFPIPRMYGGFAIEMFHSRLNVESWNRVVGGSGRAYVITPTRTTLVDEGFV